MRRSGAIAASRRSLLILVLGLILPFTVLETRESSAQAPQHPIAAAAMRHLDTHGGQCWTFMKQVVAEATGRQIGFDYRLGFFEAGAYEVSAGEAQQGDIIQIASDANTSPWASYPGLHTAIILENLGGGVFNAIDSNQNWDEWVRLRPNYDPYAAAARYGLQVHIYRVPLGDGSTPEVAAPETTPAAWSAGATAVVSAGGDCLNLRSDASLSASKIDCLPSGTSVKVVSEAVAADGFVWVKVESSSGTGWVAANYLSQTAPAPTAEPVNTTAPAADAAVPLTARTDNSPGCLRVRSSAGLAGTIRDCLAAGTQVTILNDPAVAKDGYSWLEVRVEGRAQGWVASEYLIR